MRGSTSFICLALAVMAAGCTRCDGSENHNASAEGAGAGAEGEGEGERGAPSEGRSAPAPEGVRLVGSPGRYREVSIAVEAHGPGTVRLRRELTVERAAGEGFEPVEARGITLRPDCSTEVPECVELAPGAELLPPPWAGALGEAQCGADRARPAPAGRYRFVATSCDGAHRLESEPFTLAD